MTFRATFTETFSSFARPVIVLDRYFLNYFYEKRCVERMADQRVIVCLQYSFYFVCIGSCLVVMIIFIYAHRVIEAFGDVYFAICSITSFSSLLYQDGLISRHFVFMSC